MLGARLTSGMLSSVLQVEPAAGRTFTIEEDQPGGPGVVVLSHRLKEQLFAGRQPLGETISLNDRAYTVIGVMPADFRPPFIPDALYWVPMEMSVTSNSCPRGNACVRAVGRLKDGIMLQTAQVEANQIAQNLKQAFPGEYEAYGLKLVPTRDNMVASAERPLQVLLGAVGLVLLIACVNVASLFLTRTTSRQGELVVRSALGAGRSRILRQLLTESALLAAVGGVLGVGLGILGTRFLVSVAPAQTPRLAEVGTDERVLIFSLIMTTLSGLLFGLFPAWRSSRTDLHRALQAERGAAGSRSNRLGSWLVGAQVALALILLVGAGLLLKSFNNLRSHDLGFRPQHVVTAQIGLPRARYQDRVSIVDFFRRIDQSLAEMSTIQSFGATDTLPLSGSDGDVSFTLENRPPPPPGKENIVWLRRITPGYLETMRIDLVAGRSFTPADDGEAPPVVIVNQTLAEAYFPDQNPLGQRLNINSLERPVWREIVGVARSIKNFGVREPSRYAMYLPFPQLPSRQMVYVIRGNVASESLISPIRKKVSEIDPKLAVANISKMEELVSSSIEGERFTMTLLALFAVVALLLAAVGIFGIVSYNVTTRFREVGVRMALGADRWEIGKQVVGRSFLLVAAGTVVGLIGALGLTRLMTGLLFGVQVADPTTYLVVAALLAVVGLLAASFPALKAARVDPAEVLRRE